MRPGQQNRRGRGRNNGRKGQNPLSRNFESNGPDVKIRGTASHIAEKYMALARDAMSSGDQVMAENYLQHAEHYNRIIMAAQAQFQEQAGQRMRPEGDQQGGDAGQGEGGYDGDDEGYDDQPFASEQQMQPRQNEYRQPDVPRGFEPQPPMPRPQGGEPRHEGRPYEGRQGSGENRYGGEGRQGGGGQGEGRQQGEFRGRRNRHRHDNNRFRQNQGGMPANPADIAAMAAANGSGGYAEGGERRRPQPQQDQAPSSDAPSDE
ncbi:MAG: DUF4167 domain-containing protein [Hyphomicrobiaceae bacterium]